MIRDLNKCLLIIKHIDENYNKGVEEFFNDQNRDKIEQIILSVIKEFTTCNYDPKRKLFVKTLESKEVFTSEIIELKTIVSINDLYDTIDHLNQVYHKPHQQFQQKVPQRLYEFPKEIQDISRDNVLTFLKESYQIQNEKEFWSLNQNKYKEIVYDMYRTFTGGILLKDNSGDVSFRLPNRENVYLTYTEFPEFSDNADLDYHIRDMIALKEHVKEMYRGAPSKRLLQLKRVTKQQDQEQNI